MSDDRVALPGHNRVVRISHWVTSLAFVALVVSGYVITMSLTGSITLRTAQVLAVFLPATPGTRESE
jgi:Ni,Fe-hydrogenase I cytochrome b subunit